MKTLFKTFNNYRENTQLQTEELTFIQTKTIKNF